MPVAKTLVCQGYRDAVPNTFLTQESPSVHLAVILPGLSYTCERPCKA